MMKLTKTRESLLQQHLSSLSIEHSTSLLFICGDGGVVSANLPFMAHCSSLLKSVLGDINSDSTFAAVSVPDFDRATVEKALMVLTKGQADLESAEQLRMFYQFLGMVRIEMKSVDLRAFPKKAKVTTSTAKVDIVELSDDDSELQVVFQEKARSNSTVQLLDKAEDREDRVELDESTHHQVEAGSSSSSSKRRSDTPRKRKGLKAMTNNSSNNKSNSKKSKKDDNNNNNIDNNSNNIFSCHICPPASTSKQQHHQSFTGLLSHLAQHHFGHDLLASVQEFVRESVGGWSCEICGEMFSDSIGSVINHFGVDHEKVLLFLSKDRADQLMRNKSPKSQDQLMGYKGIKECRVELLRVKDMAKRCSMEIKKAKAINKEVTSAVTRPSKVTHTDPVRLKDVVAKMTKASFAKKKAKSNMEVTSAVTNKKVNSVTNVDKEDMAKHVEVKRRTKPTSKSSMDKSAKNNFGNTNNIDDDNNNINGDNNSSNNNIDIDCISNNNIGCMLCQEQCFDLISLKHHLSETHFKRELTMELLKSEGKNAAVNNKECPDCGEIFANFKDVVAHRGAMHDRLIQFVPKPVKDQLLQLAGQ